MSLARQVRCSVALATFNGQQFLKLQLDSLAAQTILPVELVVRDDGSTDNTLRIVEEFARAAPFPVHIHRNSFRVDYSDNFLQAARLCTGDWIAFCDQDDVWEPQKLARVLSEIKKRPAVVFCAHRATIIDERSQPIGKLLVPKVDRVREYASLAHTLWWGPFGFTQVFAAPLIHDFPFEDRPAGVTHDCWIFWLGNILGHTLFLPDQLADYRRHGNNASSFVVVPGTGEQLLSEDAHQQYLDAERRVTRLVVYLQKHLKEYSGETATRLSEALERYGRLATFLGERAILWDRRRPIFSRLRSFVKLLLGGAYLTSRKGQIGPAAGFKDFMRLARL